MEILECINIPKTDTGTRAYILLTSRLHFDLVQPTFYGLFINMALPQYSRLQQRNVAFLEVDDNCAGDVLAFVSTHRHHRCQMPLQFRHNIPSLELPYRLTIYYCHIVRLYR